MLILLQCAVQLKTQTFHSMNFLCGELVYYLYIRVSFTPAFISIKCNLFQLYSKSNFLKQSPDCQTFDYPIVQFSIIQPSVLSNLAAAAPTSGKDRDLGATDPYRYICRQIYIAPDYTTMAKYACRDHHQLSAILVRSDMRLAVSPRLRSISAAATPTSG